jgi:hypothetical protein
MDGALLVGRWVHIATGGVVLVTGLGALLTRKGSRWHRRWGRGFFWAMAVTTLTAALVAGARGSVEFVAIAGFSFYAALVGYRVLYRKGFRGGRRAAPLDWAAAAAALLGSGAMAAYGLQGLRAGESAGVIFVVFGALGAGMAGADVRRFVRPAADPNAWWYAHLAYMLGAYIAALSAVSVTNLGFLPPVVRWLWPTAVGLPAILLWQRHYRRKFRRARGGGAAAELDPRQPRVGERAGVSVAAG